MYELRIASYAAAGTMAPHRHETSSFIVVLAGSYQECIQGRSMEHRPGAMLFYPAGEEHSQQFGREGSRKLIFSPSDSWLDLLTEAKVDLAQAPSVSSSAIGLLANRVLHEIGAEDPFATMAIEGSILELIAAFGRTFDAHDRERGVPRWLKQCHDQLEAEPGAAITHEHLALKAGRHPVHLAKAFRKTYGETIGAYQRRLRLERAQVLLRKNEALADISLECGFSSQAHFSRSFKCMFGITPSQYRDSL
jgi:AraC family transcriptional regulator